MAGLESYNQFDQGDRDVSQAPEQRVEAPELNNQALLDGIQAENAKWPTFERAYEATGALGRAQVSDDGSIDFAGWRPNNGAIDLSFDEALKIAGDSNGNGHHAPLTDVVALNPLDNRPEGLRGNPDFSYIPTFKPGVSENGESTVTIGGKTYNAEDVLAADLPSGIPEHLRRSLNAQAEQLREHGHIDEKGNWQFQNPGVRPGQDLAGAIKEGLWNTFNPSPGKVAENNVEFLYQFLTGTGRTIQEHTDRSDPVLKDFMQSPGADALRKQFSQQGFPATTDKLGYGTLEAAVDTVLPHRQNPTDANAFATNLPGDYVPNDMVYPNWSSVGTQVGGFGTPPKEYPWARATATRCTADGKPDPNGEHVNFNVINVAGRHSFVYHMLDDKPPTEGGPMRSMVQRFSWIEPIPKQNK